MIQAPSDNLKGGRYTEWLVHMTNLQGVSFLLFVDLMQPEIFGMVCGNKKKLQHSKKEKTQKHLYQA